MDPGLISRDGWAVVDDSSRPLFDSADFRFLQGENSTWPWVTQRPAGDRQDCYFFGYGHDYQQALADFIKVAGPIPLPPRFAFGAWWSRYWAYADQELDELVRGFREDDVPLDVLVIDMEWHNTFGLSWFSLKRQRSVRAHQGLDRLQLESLCCFPIPSSSWHNLHEEGLKVTLNLHPASGVQPWEDFYPEMAQAMGIDPALEEVRAVRHHQQEVRDQLHEYPASPAGEAGRGLLVARLAAGAEHADPRRESDVVAELRPLHRPGARRQRVRCCSIAGAGWAITATRSVSPATRSPCGSRSPSSRGSPRRRPNVGYAYWSHDIGGHMPGVVDPELYTRWIQFGIFSPILRTHTTKNPDAERRIWAYPEPYSGIMRELYHRRYAMLPYIYTEARRTYDTGLAFLHPLYYEWPNADEAYSQQKRVHVRRGDDGRSRGCAGRQDHGARE